jgi:cation transport ATPase
MSEQRTVNLPITGMHCALTIEKKVGSIKGIDDISVTFASHSRIASITYDPATVSPEKIKQAVSASGYMPELYMIVFLIQSLGDSVMADRVWRETGEETGVFSTTIDISSRKLTIRYNPQEITVGTPMTTVPRTGLRVTGVEEYGDAVNRSEQRLPIWHIIATFSVSLPLMALMPSALARGNLFWVFAYNTALIPLTAGVLYPVLHVLYKPEQVGPAMASCSVTVVSRSLMLKKFSPDTNFGTGT